MEFPARELRKFFKMGDHVKVIAGRYEGDTGLIVRIENNIAVIFSDLTLHEVHLCVCASVCVYVRAHSCAGVPAYVRMCMYMCACTYVYVCCVV